MQLTFCQCSANWSQKPLQLSCQWNNYSGHESHSYKSSTRGRVDLGLVAQASECNGISTSHSAHCTRIYIALENNCGHFVYCKQHLLIRGIRILCNLLRLKTACTAGNGASQCEPMFSKPLFSGLISANETRNGLHSANQGLLYKGQHIRSILCLKLTPHHTVSVDVEPISYHKMEFKGQTFKRR